MSVRERALAKLAACRPYYERLIGLRAELAAGADDWRVWGLVERHLQLAIECALDVGDLIIAANGWERPEENRHVFRILGERGVLPRDLALRLQGAAGLRNLLVHGYADVDHAVVRRVLEEDLPDLDRFARAVEAWLGPPVSPR